MAFVENNNLLINSGIIISNSERKIFLKFVLPISVIKVHEEFNKSLRSHLIDFLFYIKIQRSTFIFDDCGVNKT